MGRHSHFGHGLSPHTGGDTGVAACMGERLQAVRLDEGCTFGYYHLLYILRYMYFISL